jgi:ribosome biogenesis protein UTP30
MAGDELIDAHVSVKQCKLAVQALHAHSAKASAKQQETELLPGKEQNIWLNVTVKKIASAHKFKPVKMYLLHVKIFLMLTGNAVAPLCTLSSTHGPPPCA